MTYFCGRGRGVGQSDFPAFSVLSNSFSLKYLYTKGPYPGVACPEPHQFALIEI